MKEKLLFVTKGGENCDEGFSYVLELARALNTGIEMLMVYSKGVLDKYEDVMAAVAFAEAGDVEITRELLREEDRQDSTLRKRANRDYAPRVAVRSSR